MSGEEPWAGSRACWASREELWVSGERLLPSLYSIYSCSRSLSSSCSSIHLSILSSFYSAGLLAPASRCREALIIPQAATSASPSLSSARLTSITGEALAALQVQGVLVVSF